MAFGSRVRVALGVALGVALRVTVAGGVGNTCTSSYNWTDD